MWSKAWLTQMVVCWSVLALVARVEPFLSFLGLTWSLAGDPRRRGIGVVWCGLGWSQLVSFGININ